MTAPNPTEDRARFDQLLEQIAFRQRSRTEPAQAPPGPPAGGHLGGKRLFEYWEGGLTCAEQRDLQRHVASCSWCRQRFEEIGALVSPFGMAD